MNDINVSVTAQQIFENRTFANEGLKSQAEVIKHQAGVLFDLINKINVNGTNDASNRLTKIALTDLESSVMFATKALSRV